MERARRGLAFGLAALACPCHVPIVLTLLAGTGAGAVLAAHAGLLMVALGLSFAGAVAFGLSR